MTLTVLDPTLRPHARLAVRGLVFDMGDVLYDATVWRRWLYKVLLGIGGARGYEELFRIWDRDFLNDVHRGTREYLEAFEAFLTSLRLKPGQVDEVEAASQARRRIIEAQSRPFPLVRSTLAQLSSRGVPLVVLTDSESPSDAVRDRLARMGLGDRFAAIVSSVELGRTKPDPVCYAAALEGIGAAAAETAFVGHDAEELAGARACGMRTIAYNRDPGTTADLCLERFDELLELVAP